MKVKPILILGDSHTRSFGFIKNIFAIFLGKEIDVNLDHIDILKNSIEKTFTKFTKNDYITFLYVGEPNARLDTTLGQGPEWLAKLLNRQIKAKLDSVYMEKCFENITKLIPLVDYVITPTSGVNQFIPNLKHFNNLLTKNYPNQTIDIFSHTLDENDHVKKYYLQEDWYKDPVHLNSHIHKVFLDVLANKKIIEDQSVYKIDSKSEIQFLLNDDKLKYNVRFGSLHLLS